jgi:hypothetical protein
VRQTYCVPVRESQAGTLALRTGRLTSGERVGLAFTSEASLLLTMGPSQQWIRLAAEPLRDMLAPLGVQCIRIDPCPAGELRPAGLPQPRATSDGEPRTAKTPVRTGRRDTGGRVGATPHAGAPTRSERNRDDLGTDLLRGPTYLSPRPFSVHGRAECSATSISLSSRGNAADVRNS